MDYQYQVYAFTAEGKLNHAGVLRSTRKQISKAKIKRYEKEWEKWREKYLNEHPGDFPLRTECGKTISYWVHPLGQPEKKTAYYV